ncbi:MAG TPA: permease-like cell division protein FtsX [Syntrophomonadaceae bacterium]|nr:permease-like cell division protein FtsX [Syntrophomonadaceae bacterium]
MYIKNMKYFFKQAFRSMSRNRLLSLATVSTVTVCILILGMALLIILNTSGFMARLESDVEIVAYLNKDLTTSQISDLRYQIQALNGVQSVQFVSRDQALQELQKSVGAKDYNLGTTLDKNPLPNSYEVKALDPHNVPNLAASIKQLYGVDKVNYGQGVVERLFKITRWIRTVSIVLIILLALGAIFLIATTIRLAVYARRKEVYLMKLIGAADWFIRWPFFLEGILLGSAGGLIALLLLAAGYSSIIGQAKTLLFLPLFTGTIPLLTLYGGLLITGALLGMLGTLISLNRFLDV